MISLYRIFDCLDEIFKRKKNVTAVVNQGNLNLV